jgi:hypothetical protein
MYEGQGDKVTDDSIGSLMWNPQKDFWEQKWLLAGKNGWGCSGPNHCNEDAIIVTAS